MERNVFGIDLGTTYSSICLYRSHQYDIISDKKSLKYISSMVYISKSNGKITTIHGNFAKKLQNRHPKNVAFDIKRLLGQKYDDPIIQKIIKNLPFKVERSDTGGILISFPNIEKKYEPYELSGEFLKYLVDLGNTRFKPEEQVKDVVITIPANFNDLQRQETVQAAEYAGLNVLTIINEPTAAGIAFGLQNKNVGGSHVVVFDFGGGTLDVSLLHVDEKSIHVEGTEGDMFLGGRDFDERTVEYLMEKLSLDKKLKNKLRDLVVDAKIELSNSETSIIVSDDGSIEEYEMSLEEFEEINKDLIERILLPVERLLNNVNVKKSEISDIILVGGSSRMQFVKRKIKEFFGKEPYDGVEPAEAVVYGASVVAYEYANNWDSSRIGKIIEYTEICSFSIGTSIYEESMMFIIRKGTEIPAERRMRFHTVYYRQKDLIVNIYEGEHANAKNNHLLTQFQIEDIPISDKEIEFDVIFKLDKNSILNASVQLVGSDSCQSKDVRISKIRPKMTEEVDDNVNIETSRFKIFYQNIQRFIEFNYDELKYVYLEETLSNWLEEAKNEEKFFDPNDFPDVKMIADRYKNQTFKDFFTTHMVPDFLTKKDEE